MNNSPQYAHTENIEYFLVTMSYLMIIYPNRYIQSGSLKQKFGFFTSGISGSWSQFEVVGKIQECVYLNYQMTILRLASDHS